MHGGNPWVNEIGIFCLIWDNEERKLRSISCALRETSPSPLKISDGALSFRGETR
jgi:hypothetical protein